MWRYQQIKMEAAPHGYTCTYIITSRVSIKIASINLSKLVGVDLDVNAIRNLFDQICAIKFVLLATVIFQCG